MREVQVTAVRRLSETGIQATVLDTVVLHSNVALSMSDILTQNTSLYIKSYGRATESTAEFRGTSPAHTQVLWNGMRINSPMLGTVNFSTIPAFFIDRATLLHGASSLTLTGGGLGGAIDLATLPVSQQGITTQYVQGIGSYSTFDQFLRITAAPRYSSPEGGRCRWRASTRIAYSTSRNDFHYTNYDKKIDERDADGNIVRSYHPTECNRSGYFRDLNVLQEAYCDTRGHGNFGLAAWFTHSLRGLPFLSVDYRDDADFTNEHLQNAIRAVASWQHTLAAPIALDMRLGYAYQNIAYDYYTERPATTASGTASNATSIALPATASSNSPATASTAASGGSPTGTTRNIITQSESRSQQAFLQAKADYMPAPDWLLTANLNAAYVHVRSNDRSPYHIGDNYNRGRMETALSISAKYRPTRRLALSAILREELYARDLVPIIPALFAEYTLINSKRPAPTTPPANLPSAPISPPTANVPASSADASPLSTSAASAPAGSPGGSLSLIAKASIARNYRYPSMDDLYFRPGGNPDLRPERGFTYDGGLELHMQRGPFALDANAAAFDSYITDWILWTPNAHGYWQPANMKRVHSYGVELRLAPSLTLPHDWHIALTANYAYTPAINRSHDLDEADTSSGKQLVYIPLHSANATAVLTWRTWTLRYLWHSYSERYTTTSNEVSRITGRLRPYYMSDLMFEKQLHLKRLHLAIKAVIYNLLDSEYVTVLSRPMPGRHFEITLDLRPQWKVKKE